MTATAEALDGLPAEKWVQLYTVMVRIRQFEERILPLLKEGKIKGTAHPSVGQEAVAAGVYFVKGDVPDGEGLERIGVAARRREGTDVTLVSYSLMSHRCLEAADLLAQRGISCEVIDLRTIRPWDREAVLASVRKTHRLVVVHEAVKSFGAGAEIAATVMEEAFDDLDAPVVRVGAHDIPMPFNEALERETVPTVERILAAVQ
jgi:pyruvate/2-oxoglutarate/acetoin dehydrogenase E1 component